MSYLKYILFIIFISSVHFLLAQKTDTAYVSLERNLLGVQIGILEGDIYYEIALEKNISVRGELGTYLIYNILGRNNALGVDPRLEAIFYPAVFLAPRLYYNLDKRFYEGKNISNNSANFFSLRVGYIPPNRLFEIIRFLEVPDTHKLLVEQTWGLKRNLGRLFDVELELGLGYITEYTKGETLGELFIAYHLRFGFKKVIHK